MFLCSQLIPVLRSLAFFWTHLAGEFMVCTLSKSAAIFEVCKNGIISRSLAHVARAQEANTVHCSPVCNSDLLIPAGHVCVIDDISSTG